MTLIAALFVATGGPYFGLPDVDPWDEKRDARTYPGPWSVVAHPPCARWCRLAELVQSRGGPPVGDDDGCFASALDSVRRYGGVLEHPAHSKAWAAFGLSSPRAGRGWQGDGKQWACEVSQANYGHRAQKRTWLYFVGPQPPWLHLGTPEATATVTTSRGRKAGSVELQSHAERARTPAEFRDVLLALARSVGDR